MKNNQLYTWLWISMFFFTGCESFLDEKPDQTLVIPQTLDDFQALLDAEPRSMNSTSKMGFIASDEAVFSNALLNLMTLEERGAYFWEKDIYAPDDAGVDWSFSYRKIFYANVVLEGIRDFSPKSVEEEKRARELEAAAKFYRAMGHFSLAQQFAQAYNPNQSEQEGIPIRKDADINASSPRVNLKEVYAFILEDLTENIEAHPVFPEIATRPSRWAAEALLSRIYLSIQDYEKAFEHSGKALEIKDKLLDYNDLDLSLRYKFARFHEEVIHYDKMYSGRFTVHNQLLVNPELYKLYDSLDLRKGVFFRPSPIKNRFYLAGKYTGDANLFTGLATDEVLLDHAESAVRLGYDLIAVEDLTYLLANRYLDGNAVSVEGLSGNKLLRKVLEERRKELVYRGIRWLDLRRLNQDIEFGVTIDRGENDSEAVLLPNSEGYVFPIPPRELNLNEQF
ncbi:RagB/SusD family nutrient uptake outer membrane protein [Algoriphagus persicinus]|uniref:RagB/SusD family nutrient uptake outer membrane protein n=1 Tax=Algoriphagus persicinus TaxID=3108754 RepID=UPI002B39F603|nr:RagB/SusD family nutrient uptake outer membrane protein [Algoriphagus sp. E1-3-M2]MEB2787188.1 RagB/SusD family nutrient uptake outer membrane protein [Algoriphagus sp. E1-3-M2]